MNVAAASSLASDASVFVIGNDDDDDAMIQKQAEVAQPLQSLDIGEASHQDWVRPHRGWNHRRADRVWR